MRLRKLHLLIPSDNVGLTQTNNDFTPTLTATTGNPYEGVYNDSPYWGFTPADGSLNGTVAVNYTGRQLSASNTVTLANNVANATVDVNYLADLYIVTDNGVTNDWHFDGTYGEHMTYSDGIYTATFTAENPTTFILFARKLGENDPWGTRYVFGPSSGGDWWLPASGNGNGTIDLNTSHPIRIQDAGTYIVTINANNNTFTITKEVVNEGDFVLVTDDSQLAAGNEVIIVSSGSAGTARTMGQRNNNNYYGTAVTVTNTLKVSPTENTQIFTLEAGNEGWYFKTFDNLYLTSTSASPSSSGNNLNTKAKDANGTGTSLAAITIGSNNNAATIHFQGNGNRKYLRYNTNNGVSTNTDIFSCYQYATSQADVFIYKRSASAEPSITVDPTSLSFENPADGTSQSQAVTVTESNTTGSTSVSITGTGAASYSATLENGTLTVTYSGSATQANPDVATITLTNGGATATVEVTGYKLPVTLTITPADGHTFQGSTVSGMIESNVDGATIEYSFDGTNWMTYDSDEGFTATVNEVGGTVTVYARTTVNGETATAQATYTRIPKTSTCTADIVFNPTTNGGNMSTWSGLQNHISEGADYVSNATVSTIITSKDNSAMRFGSSSYLGNLSLELNLEKFEGEACKLTKVTIVAAAYTGDSDCALKVSTNVNSQGQTNEITAPVTDFGEYVFNFGGDEITTLTIGNTAVSGRVFVRSISLEYSCGSGVSAPVIDPATGLYYSDQTVTITDANENAVIYYTTDGTDPTTSSTPYNGSFVVPYVFGGSTTIKAIAVVTDDGEQLESNKITKTIYHHYAALRKLVDWKDGELVVNPARVGRHFFACRHEANAKSNRTNFLKYMHKIEMLQQERRQLLEAEGVTDERKAVSSPADELIKQAIETMMDEGVIKHSYDLAFVMQLMKETDGLPHFDSPNSFLTYISDLGIDDLPSEDSIKKKLSATFGKYPAWRFTDQKGKDATEAKRRNNVASRFLSLYRKGK